MTEQSSNLVSFNNLGIAPRLLDVLNQLHFVTPTPIQLKSIPISIEGKDMVGIAQTGTGKTLAFGIPMIQRLAQHGGRGLVLLPTRELAIQVNENLKTIGSKFGLRTAVLIGGESKNLQLKALHQKPHIIIATPGRLIDHLQSHTINLREVKILVLDEADMMFDMGFIPQVMEILKSVPPTRQTLLFSATMPVAITTIIAKHMALPVRIEVAPSGTLVEQVTQEVIIIKKEDKLTQLQKILTQYIGSVLIFVRTKHGAKNLAIKLGKLGYKVAEIHSNRSLSQRGAALQGFKTGKFRILVATDIAARGIDVKGIELVLNFDLPDSSHDYVHRIGRTARAGKPGQAITFAGPSEMAAIRKIEQIIKKSIPQTHLAKPEFGASSQPQRSYQPHNRRPVSHDRFKPRTGPPHGFAERRQPGSRPGGFNQHRKRSY